MSDLYSILGIDDQKDVWVGLPQHIQENNDAEYEIQITIKSKADMERFADLIGQVKLKQDHKTNTKSIWHPALVAGERGGNDQYIWVEEE